jgi:hypothetical protein
MKLNLHRQRFMHYSTISGKVLPCFILSGLCGCRFNLRGLVGRVGSNQTRSVLLAGYHQVS